MPKLEKLVDRVGILFADLRLLESALMHRSFAHEHPDQAYGLISNERLEFLGDSILNYLVADLVYARFPERGEGELTALRATLVRTTTLAALARQLDLGAYVRMSKGEESSGARNRDALLADTFEALVAAIYLDRGIEGVRSFVTGMLEPEIARIQQHGLVLDYKSRLQERVQAERNLTPAYHILSVEGPDHKREFTVEVCAGTERLGLGRGHSKQSATQDAARAALEALNNTASETAA